MCRCTTQNRFTA